MVSGLNRMMLRDLFSARLLLLAVMSIITVGVMCYVTMQSAYRNLEGAKQRYYVQCQMADFWISLRKAPRSEIERLKGTPGLAAPGGAASVPDPPGTGRRSTVTGTAGPRRWRNLASGKER